MYIILAILISFRSNKIGVYKIRQIKKLTWLQACFLGDVGVIWCNSLGDSLFQIYVMNFEEIVLDYYSHITSLVSQVFLSYTHYTSYSLLNSVHVIVCDFGLANQVWKFLKLYAKCVWRLRISGELFENLIFGKLGSKQVFLKSISSHTHAFYSLNTMLWGVST